MKAEIFNTKENKLICLCTLSRVVLLNDSELIRDIVHYTSGGLLELLAGGELIVIRYWRIYMLYVILFLSPITALLIAYTMSMQKTTHAIGRLLMNKSADEPGAGVQDAITPKSQTVRNLLMFMLILIVFTLTTYHYAWYHALWVVIVCFFGSPLLSIIFGLHPGSPRLVASIAKNMEKRRQAYLNSNNTLRAEVIGELISKLNQLSPEAIQSEAKR